MHLGSCFIISKYRAKQTSIFDEMFFLRNIKSIRKMILSWLRNSSREGKRDTEIDEYELLLFVEIVGEYFEYSREEIFSV